IGEAEAGSLAEALTRESQLAPLRRARDVVTDPDLRLLLALLLTQQERGFLKPTIKSYTGLADPDATIAAWIRRLASQRVLGIPDDDETERVLLSCLARGTAAALDDARANGDGLRSHLESVKSRPNDYWPEYCPDQLGENEVRNRFAELETFEQN